MVRRAELTMIMEAKKERMQKYLERSKNDNNRKENDESDNNVNRTERKIIKENDSSWR